MSQRSGPVGGRRTTRRVKNQPPATPKPDGNRAARRAWKRYEARGTPKAAFAPEEAQDGQTAAHGPAGRHHGCSADDTEEQTTHG
ncbi:hypothetical protein MXD62_20100 [Frankia sp. Mgl5]|uniref:hypothetical protein n=1 Tax=Frankia sp. Mgl5 TaxID=2933793 RepID=UPI0020107060|nr:hypothetical protein [Frankia sp. Mgl5]MCK9929454.1 hypothetical protein [Frankia sp. Mgl5]